MKDTPLTKAADKVIALKMLAVDILMTQLVEPLEKVGNPEDLIKKPYEQWTPQDFSLLAKIYGTGDNAPLARTIFDREYNKVKELEAEEV